MTRDDRNMIMNDFLMLETGKEDYEKYHDKGLRSRVNQIVRHKRDCPDKEIKNKIFDSYEKIPKNERDKRFVKRGIKKEEQEESRKKGYTFHEKSYNDYIRAKERLEKLYNQSATKEEIKRAERDLDDKYKKMEILCKRKINNKSIPDKFKDYDE